MFKYAKRRGGPKGEATRRQVLEAALELFRRGGYERTTMRAIAKHAGLSLGAAYHYFDSKDAILGTYFEWTQDEHERSMASAPPSSALRERIVALFETKLSVVQKDRKLLAALFGRLGDPTDPLCVFGKRNSALRERSIQQFTGVLSDVPLPEELRNLAGRLLWLSHLAMLLYFVHDRSLRQAKTHHLVAVLADLAVALPWLAHPHAAALRSRLLAVLADLAPSPRPVS
jgi:AcrR family transcriptional regulator